MDEPTDNGNWRQFIEQMTSLRGKRGRAVALNAFDAGLSLNDLECVLLHRKEGFPRLLFYTEQGQSFAFTPTGTF